MSERSSSVIEQKGYISYINSKNVCKILSVVAVVAIGAAAIYYLGTKPVQCSIPKDESLWRKAHVVTDSERDACVDTLSDYVKENPKLELDNSIVGSKASMAEFCSSEGGVATAVNIRNVVLVHPLEHVSSYERFIDSSYCIKKGCTKKGLDVFFDFDLNIEHLDMTNTCENLCAFRVNQDNHLNPDSKIVQGTDAYKKFQDCKLSCKPHESFVCDSNRLFHHNWVPFKGHHVKMVESVRECLRNRLSKIFQIACDVDDAIEKFQKLPPFDDFGNAAAAAAPAPAAASAPGL